MNKVFIPFQCLIRIYVVQKRNVHIDTPTHIQIHVNYIIYIYMYKCEQPSPQCSQMKAVFSVHRLGYGSRFASIIPKNAK